ncbi:MAG: dTDP-4-dehydrorhamnose 3,5-epimerase [Bryobacterales bacterium]|nr:dTDP-4-dehydrorhamnose 3,5-epimerase [Bryobacterales bacterium]
MPCEFKDLALGGVTLVVPRVFKDDRGYFLESYKYSEFAAAGITERFVQENHSFSTAHVVRGLHFQLAPKAQGKLVRVVQGSVWDVAVDLRPDSPTFGKWVAAELSDQNHHQLYLPPWCAHGFCVLSEVAQVVYKVTDEYSPQHEGGIAWDDPQLAIDWPEKQPGLSARDQKWPPFAEVVKRLQS